MKYFRNETDTLNMGGLSFENRLDRISLNGGVDITLDMAGYNLAKQLTAQFNEILVTLEAYKFKGQLPDDVALIPPTPAGNIFGMSSDTEPKRRS